MIIIKKPLLKLMAYTLAEVLITLLIIGLVSTLTIPALISKINEKVSENQDIVFKSKLIKGLNLAKTSGDLNNTYTSTYDFLENGLSKYLKISKICDSAHIRECFPYDSIKYEINSTTEDTALVSKLTTGAKIKLRTGNFKDTASFVLADGTPAIVSYDLDCEVDTDQADRDISPCLGGIYDINGTRNPNKFGTKVETDFQNNEVTTYINDVRSFNGASVAPCVGKLNEVCVATTAQGIFTLIDKMQAAGENVPTFNHWSGLKPNLNLIAENYCQAQGAHLSTAHELAVLASIVFEREYGDTEGSTISSLPGYNGSNNPAAALLKKNDAKIASIIGIGVNGKDFLAGDGSNTYYHRYFYNNSGGTSYGKWNEAPKSVYVYFFCVGDN